MAKRPLDMGEKLHSKVVHDSRGTSSHFFNHERLTTVVKEDMLKRLERGLGDCKACPHAKINFREELESSTGKSLLMGEAVCDVSAHRPCPVKEDESAYLGMDEAIDPATLMHVPRRGGKSMFTGAQASKIFYDEATSSEDDLEEAVDFELNEPKYDNFGSW